MRDYSTLHLDTNLSKGTGLLLLFCIGIHDIITFKTKHDAKDAFSGWNC